MAETLSKIQEGMEKYKIKDMISLLLEQANSITLTTITDKESFEESQKVSTSILKITDAVIEIYTPLLKQLLAEREMVHTEMHELLGNLTRADSGIVFYQKLYKEKVLEKALQLQDKITKES